jgi:predicted DNA-binding protein (MmcQ/YjbR family)
MGQVTIYLDNAIEQKMNVAAKSAHLSKSKWISKILSDKLEKSWPQSVIDSAHSWEDFPNLEQVRSDLGKDVEREPF